MLTSLLKNKSTSNFLLNHPQRAFAIKKQYDVAVIGGGPGGYTAAIRAAQKGLKTVCIDNKEHIGGVGVNEGCIPSKALLNYTSQLTIAKEKLGGMGIETGNIKANFNKMQQAKEKAVRTCTDDIKQNFKELGVHHMIGWGRFTGTHGIAVDMKVGGTEEIKAKNIIIATGSEPNELKDLPFDEKYLCSSQGALEQESLPKELMIYGGGIVGIEIGCVYQRLGTNVTIVQRSERICQFLDPEICALYVKALQDQGIKFLVNTEIMDGENKEERGIYLNMRHMVTKEEYAEKTDLVLISIGRHPKTEGMDLEKAGIKTNNRGMILTNDTWQVEKQPHIYGVGDCVKGTMLVHKAEIEAIAVVNHIAEGKGSVNYNCIPGVIYTDPEVAWVGVSEEDLQKSNTPYNKGVVNIKSNFRASITHQDDGIIKVMTCPETHKFLGIWILSHNAGEMIAEGVAAYHNGATVQTIAETSHAHPTLSEAFRQACLATYDKATY